MASCAAHVEWKGNVRELQHVMERASIVEENGDAVLAEHLHCESVFASSSRPPTGAERAS